MLAREAKERQLVAQTVINTKAAFSLCGYLCKASQDVDNFVSETESSKLQDSLLAQIKYFKSVKPWCC